MGARGLTPQRIIARDGFDCHYCHEPMNVYANPNTAFSRSRSQDKRRFTFEHIVPRSMGGTYGLYNIVGACSECNGKMGNKYIKCFCPVCQNARVRHEMREMRVS